MLSVGEGEVCSLTAKITESTVRSKTSELKITFCESVLEQIYLPMVSTRAEIPTYGKYYSRYTYLW